MGSRQAKLAEQYNLTQHEVAHLQRRYELLCQIQGTTKTSKLDKTTFLTHFTNKPLGEIIFNAFDTSRNGIVDFEEYVEAIAILTNGSEEDKIEFIFSVYDQNATGKISREQFRSVMELFVGAYTVIFTEETLGSANGSPAPTPQRENSGIGKNFGSMNRMGSSMRAAGDSSPDSSPRAKARRIAEKIEAVYRTIDVDGKGEITKSEFVTYCQDNPFVLQPLNTILSAVKKASYWDWELGNKSDYKPPSPELCVLM